MPKLTLLVGPPGSGKSTWVENNIDRDNTVYINQDTQGKIEHFDLFQTAVANNKDIVVDRMNFNKEQRKRYTIVAGDYEVEIHVLHESYDTCYARMANREAHPTIKNEKAATDALTFFFKNYERVSDDEGKVIRRWPKGLKPPVIVCDLDGTLCNIDHRLKFVRTESGKPNWPMFFAGINKDAPNPWCQDILEKSLDTIILCSGRGEEYRGPTETWLNEHLPIYNRLYMRLAKDYRPDHIVKEIILEFELKTRYSISFCIDDRQQVVDMWRRHGLVCLQCAKGDF